MELIESTFSGTSKQEEKDAEARKQVEEQSLPEVSALSQSVSDTTGKEENARATAQEPGAVQEKKSVALNASKAEKAEPHTQINQDNGASEDNDADDTPRKVPALKIEKTPDFKPPVTPRKHVIPSRRAGIEPGKTPASARHDALSDNATPVEHAVRTPFPETGIPAQAPEEKQLPIWPDESRDAADLPTRTGLTAAHAPTPAPQLSPISLPAADLPPLPYHDTSAAEEAWHALDVSSERNKLAEQDTHVLPVSQATPENETDSTNPPNEPKKSQPLTIAVSQVENNKLPETPLPPELAASVLSSAFIDIPTTPLPAFAPVRPLERRSGSLTRKKALFLVLVLTIILINASAAGFNQFFGPQGWGSTFSSGSSGAKLLAQIAPQLKLSPKPGTKGTPTPPTPTQIVNLLMSNMTLDEKLGQMMMVQFAGQSYSPELDAMISQYHIGSVLYFQFNIGSKAQLTGLNTEMQHNSYLPLLISVDQEGGTVDRLTNLDGPQPPAAQIGATGNPNVAYQQGIKDARDLASYGFNLNLAPVVDVNNVYNPQLYDRTFGNNPATVTKMASAYLSGLQQSGKVLGTLKHFPGLGDVSTDPHYGLPALTRSLSSLNAIDWAPYRNLIKQGNVYSIMVTHEIVDALDKTEPSSLSPAVIGILRNEMHFQGVIITDSLTMDSIHNFYTYGEAAAKAVEAGDDILMGADSPATLAEMITGIKQAMDSGAITQQHIDDSVRRILLLKYEMGLLHI